MEFLDCCPWSRQSRNGEWATPLRAAWRALPMSPESPTPTANSTCRWTKFKFRSTQTQSCTIELPYSADGAHRHNRRSRRHGGGVRPVKSAIPDASYTVAHLSPARRRGCTFTTLVNHDPIGCQGVRTLCRGARRAEVTLPSLELRLLLRREHPRQVEAIA